MRSRWTNLERACERDRESRKRGGFGGSSRLLPPSHSGLISSPALILSHAVGSLVINLGPCRRTQRQSLFALARCRRGQRDSSETASEKGGGVPCGARRGDRDGCWSRRGRARCRRGRSGARRGKNWLLWLLLFEVNGNSGERKHL